MKKESLLRVECTLKKEQQDKLDLVREMLADKYGPLSWAELITAMAQEVIDQEESQELPMNNQGDGISEGPSRAKVTVKAQDKVKSKISKEARKVGRKSGRNKN